MSDHQQLDLVLQPTPRRPSNVSKAINQLENKLHIVPKSKEHSQKWLPRGSSEPERNYNVASFAQIPHRSHQLTYLQQNCNSSQPVHGPVYQQIAVQHVPGSGLPLPIPHNNFYGHPPQYHPGHQTEYPAPLERYGAGLEQHQSQDSDYCDASERSRESRISINHHSKGPHHDTVSPSCFVKFAHQNQHGPWHHS